MRTSGRWKARTKGATGGDRKQAGESQKPLMKCSERKLREIDVGRHGSGFRVTDDAHDIGML